MHLILCQFGHPVHIIDDNTKIVNNSRYSISKRKQSFKIQLGKYFIIDRNFSRFATYLVKKIITNSQKRQLCIQKHFCAKMVFSQVFDACFVITNAKFFSIYQSTTPAIPAVMRKSAISMIKSMWLKDDNYKKYNNVDQPRKKTR